MSYTTLTGSKGSVGSILNWVGYSKVDVATVLDEAQALIYNELRVREMRKEWVFGIAVNQSKIALPLRFLDPIDDILLTGPGIELRQKTPSSIKNRRVYDDSLSGSFGNNPFTTALGSGFVSCVMAAHGLTQESDITIAGAAVVDGITMNGTFPVSSITDASTFVIDTGGSGTAGGVTGGGAVATWTANMLVTGSPSYYGMWDEAVHFDIAFETAYAGRQLYFQSLPLLSAGNLTNFLTVRYPHLMRVATTAASAAFMEDDGKYTQQMQALTGLIQSIHIKDDLSYRGAELDTDTP